MAHKDAYYFPHDSNAKDDPKVVWLIEQLGLEGYGIFWILIETLRDQPGYRYPLSLVPPLARKYNTTTEKMKAVICGYGLFHLDEDDFFSMSLLKRMAVIDDKREKAKKAIEARWARKREEQLPEPAEMETLSPNTDVLPPYYDGNTRRERVKERKEEERKEEESKGPKKYGTLSNVLLSDYEIHQLELTYENPRGLIDKISLILANAKPKDDHFAFTLKIAMQDKWPRKKVVIPEPEEKIDAVPMPDDIREKMKQFNTGLGL